MTRLPRWQLVAALILSGLTMRVAVTSVGSVLNRIQDSLHASSTGIGVLTTLPVLVFAVFGSLTPRWAERFGAPRVLVAGLVVSIVGMITRVLVSSLWAFLLLSVLALVGASVTNVVLPGTVKRFFPDDVGRMTAIYSTALAAGATAAAGLTVPLGSWGGADSGDRWRFGIAIWVALIALAIVPWLAMLRPDRDAKDAVRPPAITARELLRSRTAKLLVLFFGFQSMQAYISFGWYAKFLHDHGMSNATAGALVALYSGVSIPVSMIVPRIRQDRHRTVLIVLAACWGAAYAAFGIAPSTTPWLWMILAGIGSGSFPLILALFAMRSRTPEVTTSLSAVAQAGGYLMAGVGPLLFGVLHGATNGWAAPLALLWVSLALATITGWYCCTPHMVDDELAASAA